MHFLRARRIRGGGEATGGEGGVVVQVGRNTPVLAGNPRLLCGNALKFHCGECRRAPGASPGFHSSIRGKPQVWGDYLRPRDPGRCGRVRTFLWVRRRNLWGLFSQLPAAQAGDPARNFLNPHNGGMVGRGGSVGLNHDLAIDSNPQSPGPPLGSWLSPEHPSQEGFMGFSLGMPSDIIFPFQTCPHCISMQTLRAGRRVHAIGVERLHTASGCRAYHAPYPIWR